MKPLDFVIIGAGKSGTTTLHQYLSRHPDIDMPPEKEIPFFSRNELYERGWDEFARACFLQAGSRRFCGKATPDYMLHSAVPARLHRTFPDAKLIAILRHPVERAYSHWKMHARNGIEDRSFEAATAALLKSAPTHAVDSFEISPENAAETYIIGGLYGRILERWFDLFSRDQMLVLFTEDLANDPLTILQRIHEFLGVSADFVPRNLGKSYNVGEIQRLKKVVPRPIWRCLPKTIRRRLGFWLESWNIVPDNGNLPKGIYEQLCEFYQEDVERLEGLIGHKVPWEDLRREAFGWSADDPTRAAHPQDGIGMVDNRCPNPPSP
jgi:hypothetical protein